MCPLLLFAFYLFCMRAELLCMQQTYNLHHMFVDITSQLGHKLSSVEEAEQASWWVIHAVTRK